MDYLKKAPKTAASDETKTRARVAALLDELEAGGESATRALAEKLDRWTGDIVVARRSRPPRPRCRSSSKQTSASRATG